MSIIDFLKSYTLAYLKALPAAHPLSRRTDNLL